MAALQVAVFHQSTFSRRATTSSSVVELPGIDKNDLEIEATASAAEKRLPMASERPSLSAGLWRVDRTLPVPIRIEPGGIKAEYRDGMLALFVPRAEAARAS